MPRYTLYLLAPETAFQVTLILLEYASLTLTPDTMPGKISFHMA
jgi:hypothetical protein